jgi:hypothetical protein
VGVINAPTCKLLQSAINAIANANNCKQQLIASNNNQQQQLSAVNYQQQLIAIVANYN